MTKPWDRINLGQISPVCWLICFILLFGCICSHYCYHFKPNPVDVVGFLSLVYSVCPSTPRGAHATCTPAGCCSPSCPASVATPLRRYCSGPVPASQSSPFASCCVGCTRLPWAWRLRAGTAPPGRRTSPWTPGWDDRAAPTSYTERSPDPWSWAESAWRTYLQKEKR